LTTKPALKRIWPYTVPAQTHSPRPKVTVEHSRSYLLPPSAPRSSSGFSGSNLCLRPWLPRSNSPASRVGIRCRVALPCPTGSSATGNGRGTGLFPHREAGKKLSADRPYPALCGLPIRRRRVDEPSIGSPGLPAPLSATHPANWLGSPPLRMCALDGRGWDHSRRHHTHSN
jgi:hypothetical protein